MERVPKVVELRKADPILSRFLAHLQLIHPADSKQPNKQTESDRQFSVTENTDLITPANTSSQNGSQNRLWNSFNISANGHLRLALVVGTLLKLCLRGKNWTHGYCLHVLYFRDVSSFATGTRLEIYSGAQCHGIRLSTGV